MKWGVRFAHTKLWRESFLLLAKSTSTKPANDGLYDSLFEEELSRSVKLKLIRKHAHNFEKAIGIIYMEALTPILVTRLNTFLHWST